MNFRYKVIILFTLLFLSAFYGSAQVSQKAQPRTMRATYEKNNTRQEAIPSFVMTAHTPTSIATRLSKKKEECPTCKSGSAYGIAESLNVDVLSAASAEKINEGTIYRYVIEAAQAKGLQIYFDEFVLPVGGEVYVYNQDKSMTLGAFTHANNSDGNGFLLQVVKGTALTVEYFEPTQADHKSARLKIKDVIYCFKDVFGTDRSFDDDRGCDLSCIPHAACESGWKEPVSSVGLLLIYTPSLGLAHSGTGTLMNNTNQDMTPYFLTAYHISQDAPYWSNPASTIIVQFNHQKSFCGPGDDDQDLTNSISGAQYLAGNASTDFVLLKLYERPPIDYHLTYAGWENFDNLALTTGPYTSIHHPCAALKRVSKTSTIQSAGYAQAPGTGNNWYLTWTSGVTQPGSSGAPLFNAQKQVIGFLHGGYSNCTFGTNAQGYPVSPSSADWFNKLSASWASLAPFLSPNTNFHTFNSYTPTAPEHCFNKFKDLGEASIDCGGTCPDCPPNCFDQLRNGTEDGMDCGGPCTPCPTCNDGIPNGTETGVDCGNAECGPCPGKPTCSDHVQNQGETGIDCGGPCGSCTRFCSDGRRNGDELMIDCGGSCGPCANLIPNGVSSGFEIPKTCFDFGDYRWAQYYLNPFTVENDKCNTGWKSVYGLSGLFMDGPSNNVLVTWQGSHQEECLYNNARSNRNITQSAGVYYQLPFNLDPKKQYTLFFKMRTPPSTLDKGWQPTDYVEVAVTRGLIQSHIPSTGLQEYRGCDFNYVNKDYLYPAYVFEKQTLVATSAGRETDWQLYQVDFTVESPNLNQIFLATLMDNFIVNGYYHNSVIHFDDFILQEKPRITKTPFVHSSQIAAGGGGFYTGGEFPFIPGPECTLGSVDLSSNPKYLTSINVEHNITVHDVAVQKNTQCKQVVTADQTHPLEYFCDILSLNAGDHVDFGTGIDIAVGVSLTADIVPCGIFHGMIRDSNPEDQLEAVQEKTFTLYPNPSQGMFTVLHSLMVKDKYTIYVYNSLGQVVYEKESTSEETEINLSHFNQGVYLVKIVEEDGTMLKTEKAFIWH